ncbi:pyruvate kinase [Lachnospiraceae bacterium 45-W7]
MDIYGTIGPACADIRSLTEMFRQGMTGMRLNLSHTGLSACGSWTGKIRKAAEAVGICPQLLVDLQGPELRIGSLKYPRKLQEKSKIMLKSQKGNEMLEDESVPVPKQVFSVSEPGQQILVDDGKILLTVEETGTERMICAVDRGGILTSRKSVAIPGVELQLPTLTESDRENIRAAKAYGVTGVMLPFVRSARDLQILKQELEDARTGELNIFAKIENMDGVRNLKTFLPYADQIVIARGDLGNSMALWELPAVQAEIAKVCREEGKPFMVVTQMLASMENSRVPTRAEVSDIFQAVSQGASSVMVTGETASGKYPVEAVKYLCRTVESAQRYLTGK